MRIHYALHGVRFRIDADGPVAEDIARTVMPGCNRRRAGPAETVFSVACEAAGFAVRRNRRRLWRAASAPELIPWLEADVVHWLLGKLRRFVQVHAAAVARRGGAVLLPGGPDGGKTSLACALGLAGWAVMTDEVALIEPRGSALARFPRALLVKRGTARRLPELRSVTPRRVVLEEGPAAVRYVDPRSFAAAPKDRARIAALAFPEWSRTGSVRRMGEREALERLLGATFSASRHPRRSVDTCVRLVRSVPLLRLGVGPLRQTAQRLSEWWEAER